MSTPEPPSPAPISDLRSNDAASFADCIGALLSASRREFFWLSNDLEPTATDQERMLDQFKAFALRGLPELKLWILIRDAEAPVKRGHRLIHLLRRLPTAIRLRVIPSEYQSDRQALIVTDTGGLHLREDFASYAGHGQAARHASADHFRRYFQRVWEASLSDPNFRDLGL
jgi:hypothetical protein